MKALAQKPSHSHRALARCGTLSSGGKPFQRFSVLSGTETVETVPVKCEYLSTGLKPGENETRLEPETRFKAKLVAKITTVLLIVLAVAASSLAQSRCEVGVQAPPVGFWTWTAGSQVRVYVIERDFKPDEIPSLLAPLKNWNAVSETTGSRVRFEYIGPRAASQYCENCLTIARGAVFDKKDRHLTELRAYSARNDRLLTWTTVVVDFALTNHQALTDAVAHELGHSFGLRDCYSCKAKSTVMNQFGPVNVANEMPGPTTCDVAQVKSTYKQLALQASHKPQPKKIDEGEEPVDDDTPIVVPKP